MYQRSLHRDTEYIWTGCIGQTGFQGIEEVVRRQNGRNSKERTSRNCSSEASERHLCWRGIAHGQASKEGVRWTWESPWGAFWSVELLLRKSSSARKRLQHFCHQIPYLCLAALPCSSFPCTRSQRKEDPHIFAICSSDILWTKKAFSFISPDLSYNFCTLCNKNMENCFETKISSYFSHTFIESPCYYLVVGRVGLSLSGPPSFSSIWGK